MGIIYKATNTINGKCYIGKTKRTLDHRKRQHIKDAFVKNTDLLFHKALRKYGVISFVWDVIEECDDNILNNREIYYITYYKSNVGLFPEFGYNMTKGGDGGYVLENNPNKNEIYKKISNSNSGENHFLNKMSEEDRENYLNAYCRGEKNPRFGKVWTDEQKLAHSIQRKNNNPWKGKKHTEESRKKISMSRYNYWTGDKNPNYKKCGEKNHRSKKYVITMKSGLVFYIHSVDEFCDWYKKMFDIVLQPQNISTTAKGKNKHHKGLLVRFYDEDLDKDISYWKDIIEKIKGEHSE